MNVDVYLAAALGAVAIGIGAYVLSLSIRRRKLERRRSELASRSPNESA